MSTWKICLICLAILLAEQGLLWGFQVLIWGFGIVPDWTILVGVIWGLVGGWVVFRVGEHLVDSR